MKNIIWWIVIILVIIGGYFIYKNASQPKAPEETPGQEGIIGGGGGQETPRAREIAVSGTEFAFNPPVIEVKAGERIRLVFTNIGSVPHNFKIKQEGVDIATKIVKPTEKDTIEFVAPEKGEYTFICSVPGHLESGMYGKLKVTE